MMEKMDKFDTVIWKLRDLEENSKCADCTDSFPRYINTTHGTFVCSVCGGIHREMGNRIKSTSDKFTQSDIDKLEKVGNKMASEIWLSNWNQNQFPVPYPSDEKKVRDFIKMKYVEKKWIKDGVSPSDYISISKSTSTTPIITSPKQTEVQQQDSIRNSSEKKDVNSNSKISLSKEFESLSLGGGSNGLLNLQNEQHQQHLPTQQTNLGSSSSSSSNQQFDSNGKPFNPFRDENKYFNSKPAAEEKKSFPPFSEKPFDQHSYLTEKTGNDAASSSSSFYSKIQLQQATPKPPAQSVYESQAYQQRKQEQQEQASKRAKQIQLQLQQQEQQMQQMQQQQQYNMNNNMMNNGNQMMNNNNNYPQIQYNPFTESNNNQLALINQNDINNQQINNMQIQPQPQQQMMNNFQQQHQQHQPNLQNTNSTTSNIGNPFVTEQVILQHQAMHQQNMQQNQGNIAPNGQMMMNSNGQMIYTAPATTTTTTITHTPIGGNVASSSSNNVNPFDGSIEIYDESKLVYGKVNNDPVFPASSASFESGNSLDRSDAEQKEAWRLIHEKNIQIQEDKNLASKLQIEEENLFKSQEVARKLQLEEERYRSQTITRGRSNTEPSRTTSSYNRSTSQQYIPQQRSLQSQQHSSFNDLSYGQSMTMSSGHHRSSSGGSSSIFKRLGRSRSKSYEDPFEIPQLNRSSDGFDDYDNYMKKNKRIPGGGENYQPKFPSQPQQHYQQSQPQQNQQDYYDDPYESDQPISKQIVVHAPGTINQTNQSFTDCENCGKTVGLEAMSFHKNTECILRQERCSLCNKLVKHVQMADHHAQCQISTYTCGVCGRMIVGKDMPNHMSFVHNQ